ncbi:N-formylglutamate amidohydrolase [Nevskia ramosa]|uniref:N-formylglutamate amidohydrolase n=1 Tax=Nevskia ramosa TaxID=64002 RepID=UPI00344C0163
MNNTSNPVTSQPLIAADEPGPVDIIRADGSSPLFLICDHASCAVPRSLSALGLPDAERRRHIGWDIGAAEVSKLLSAKLDATLVMQNYSRLVIDCNRPPRVADSIAQRSDGTVIPGNVSVNFADAEQRRRAIFEPYHAAITAQLDAREARGQRSVLIAVHSFTPVWQGKARPWHVGMLYHRDARLALALGAALEREPGTVVGYNEPYDVSDESDYSIPVHGEQRGLLHVELEIRQDLIANEAGQQYWAALLARLLPSLLTFP